MSRTWKGKSLDLTWTADVGRSGTAVSLEGEFDLGSLEGIREGLKEPLAEAAREVVFDLSSLSFIDSTGLRFLLEVKNTLDARKVDLRLLEPSPAVARVIDVSGLREVFQIDPPLADPDPRPTIRAAG